MYHLYGWYMDVFGTLSRARAAESGFLGTVLSFVPTRMRRVPPMLHA